MIFKPLLVARGWWGLAWAETDAVGERQQWVLLDAGRPSKGLEAAGGGSWSFIDTLKQLGADPVKHEPGDAVNRSSAGDGGLEGKPGRRSCAVFRPGRS